MDPDLALVLGLIIGVFSIPSILSALSDSRAPRASTVTVLISAALVVYAVTTSPSGYRMENLPSVFVKVVGRYMP